MTPYLLYLESTEYAQVTVQVEGLGCQLGAVTRVLVKSVL